MKLLIVIPAYNEEQSIDSIVQRCLSARAHIMATSPVTAVDVTVVSDGSTDRTAELARQYLPDIKVIAFERNRGYGAAIQEGWAQSDAELVAFLDADGTCNPLFFSDLCNLLHDERADVVLGCRLNANSQMPALRRVGNTIFALLLGLFSSTRVKDTASGMRVVRRASLRHLDPLPTGMHFTPAMSARAMLNRSVVIRELDMPYAEREGESKLNVVKDGLRFLRVIIEAALLYRPGRPLALVGLTFLLAAVALMAGPTAYYLANHSVAEWMMYRFIVSHLAVIASAALFSASYVTSRVIGITLGKAQNSSYETAARRFLESSLFWLAPTALIVTGSVLVLPSFLELVRTGATYEHWSRFIAMSLCFSVAIILLATRACEFILSLLDARLTFVRTRDESPNAHGIAHAYRATAH
jgi:glycosyltransferase involved in cell wall biosynthesis